MAADRPETTAMEQRPRRFAAWRHPGHGAWYLVQEVGGGRIIRIARLGEERWEAKGMACYLADAINACERLGGELTEAGEKVAAEMAARGMDIRSAPPPADQ